MLKIIPSLSFPSVYLLIGCHSIPHENARITSETFSPRFTYSVSTAITVNGRIHSKMQALYESRKLKKCSLAGHAVLKAPNDIILTGNVFWCNVLPPSLLWAYRFCKTVCVYTRSIYLKCYIICHVAIWSESSWCSCSLSNGVNWREGSALCRLVNIDVIVFF